MLTRLRVTKNAIIALFIIVSTVAAVPAKFEPIVVAAPNSEEDLQLNSNNVQEEQSQQVEVTYNQIPAYLLELNDSNIGGPVDYVPAEDQSAHKFLAWDLLPPKENVENTLSTHTTAEDSQYSASSPIEADTTTSTSIARPTITTTTQRYNRGNVHFSSSTPTTKSTRRTTARRTTAATTRRYTATTPTPRTTPTTTTTPKPVIFTTSSPADLEYYRLEKGDSYTLPPWLTGLDYEDLDVAVTFIVPTDNNEYNHTIERDIEPPLEPFMDLKNINLPAPEIESSTKATTTTRVTTTTTTRAPSTTARSYWIQTNSVKNTKPSSLNNSNRITSNHNAQSGITSTTTKKPNFSSHTSFNTIPNNGQYSTHTTTSTAAPFSAETEAMAPQYNPFFNNRQNVPTTRTTTTTTTTTTTSQPELSLVDENPFVPTLPPWLVDTDYADLGPAVPFNYDPSAFEQNVDADLQAPFRFMQDKPSKPSFLTDTQSQFPSNQIPLQATDTTSALASTISNAKVNAPNSIPQDQQMTKPDFSATTLDNQQKHIPVPFEDDTPAKTTFSKGQGGKVISNTQAPFAAQGNPFLSGRPLAASSNSIPSFALTYRPAPTQNFAATTTRSVSSRTNTSTNRFGGPPGVLRPYDNVRG